MKIERRYTTAGESPYASIEFRTTKSEIRNPDGSVVFSLDNIEVPAQWSQVAADVLAQKYFRKAGVPARLKKRRGERAFPPSCGARSPIRRRSPNCRRTERYGSEISAQQVFDRLAGAWTYWGWKGGYFDTEEDAQAFCDELRYMLAMQMAAPNSPQWFNTGLHWAYGIDGPSQGHFYVDYATGKMVKSKSAYEHPQPHACFIQSIEDDLVNDGGIMDLWVREARLFKYGSGTGSNFSKLRGEKEKLSGGGTSSGLMCFLKIGDRAAGAIKSGGTTRRAAKMVVVDVDHPDIEAFIDWKVKEEEKVAALVTGSKIVKKQLKAILRACVNCEGPGDDCFNPEKNPALKREIKLARTRRGAGQLHQARHPVRPPGLQGHPVRHLRHRLGQRGLSHRLRPELQQFRARHRRVPARGREDGDWSLITPPRRQGRQDAEGARAVGQDRLRRLGLRRSRHSVPHHDQRLAHLPGRRRDPRLQSVLGIYVPRRHGLQSRLAEPVAVPRSATTKRIDVEAYEHAVRLWTIVLEISVLMAQFPSKEIAQLSYDYRTLGLGYANVGGLLMSSGVAYDSEAGRAIAGALSAIMTGVCLRDLGRNGEGARPLRALHGEPRGHAARHPQPSPRRPWRARGL